MSSRILHPHQHLEKDNAPSYTSTFDQYIENAKPHPTEENNA
jgi:hypothetical protein